MRRRRPGLIVAAVLLVALGSSRPANAQGVQVVFDQKPRFGPYFAAVRARSYTLGDAFVIVQEPTFQFTRFTVFSSGGVELGIERSFPGTYSVERFLRTPFAAFGNGTIGISVEGIQMIPGLPASPRQAVLQVPVTALVPLEDPTTIGPTSTSSATQTTTAAQASTTSPAQVPTTASTASPSPSVPAVPPPAASAGSTVSVRENRAPVSPPFQVAVGAGTTTEFVLRASNPDGNPLTFALIQLPSHGKLRGLAPNLAYTPDVGFVGIDAVIFAVTDGTNTAQGTVTITVTAPNVLASKATPPRPTAKTAVKKKATVKKTRTSRSRSAKN